MPRAPQRTPNPYRIGGPATGAQFTDRERELRKITGLMLNGQNLVLIAPRRFGKTSLLLRAAEAVREQGGRTGRESLMRCSDPQEVAESLLKAVLQGPMHGFEGHLHDISRRLAGVRVQPEFSIDPSSGLPRVRLTAGAAAIDWKAVCQEVVRLLNHVAAEGHPTSLILDEFQKVKEIQDDLPDIFKDMTDELRGVSLVFAGSKRHLMRDMVYDRDHGALYDVGAVHELEVIPRPEFVDYLCRRADDGRKSLVPALAERMYDVARGVPHDVQLVAYFAYEAAARVIDEAAFGEAMNSAVGDQKTAFQTLYPAAPSQQRLLKLIARRGWLENPYSQAVLREVKVTGRAVEKAVRALVAADLVEVGAGGRLEIVRGLFQAWLLGDHD